MKNVFLFFRNGGGRSLILLLVSFYFVPQDLKAQIFRWDMNNYSGCNPDNCTADPYTSFSSCITEPFSNNPLKSGTGSEQVLLLKENCYWSAGRYYANCNSCPIEFHPDIFLGHPALADENKFIILGKAEELRSTYTGGAVYQGFQGRSVFFDFDIFRQKRNFFYKLILRGIGTNMSQPNDNLGLAINKVLPGGLMWNGNSYNTTSIRNKIVQTIPATNFDYNTGTFNFYIEEEANGIIDGDSGPNDGLDSYFHQIGLNLGSPLGGGSPQAEPIADFNSLFMMDYLDLDCDVDNIVFRPLISRCSLSQSTNCNEVPYCVEIVTDCPNINYNAYPYQIVVSNNNNTRTFAGTGRYTQIYMDDMPAGNYTLQLVYNTSTGKNIKVKEYEQYSYEAMVDFVHSPVTEYAILNNTTFNDPIYVAKNMVVYNGATLTINNAAYFNENASLIVENGGRLLVQGLGHLTACTTQWPGVKVKSQGRAQIVNDGTISKANTGIQSNSNGAVISCQNAHFIDNVIGVKAIGGVSPTFVNTDFIGGSQGVYLDNVTGGTTPNGVLFEGNSFSYQGRQGIISYNTGINVTNGNQFTGCGEGIGIRNLFGNSQQAIVNGESVSNLFTNCDRGIYTNAGYQKVQNNIFSNNGYGGYYSGLNIILSETNSYNGGHAEAFYSTGGFTSISERNDYNSNEGIFTWQNNDNYVFKANCFSTLWYDVNAWGTINGAQGGAGVAASNCFTGGGVPDFACNTSNNVNYFLPDTAVSYPLCLIPITQGNYIRSFKSNSQNSNQCGTQNGNAPEGEYGYIKAMGCDSTQLADFIQFVSFQKIRPLLTKQKNGTITILERSELIRWQRHLRYAVNQWAWCLRKDDKYAQLYVWYKAQQDKDFDIKAVETKVMMEQYEQAIAELDSVRVSYELDTLIYQSMLLNIRAMRKDITSPTYSSAERQVLRTTAALSDPYAAYARALLYKLTGEQIEPIVTEHLIPRNKTTEEGNKEETYTVFPNPVHDNLQIWVENHHIKNVYTYTLTDVYGREMKRGALLESSEINVANLSKGLYIIQIFKNQKSGISQKIVITH